VTLQDLTNIGPDVLGISEPNIQWTSKQTDQFRQAIHSLWPYSKAVYGNCPPDAHFSDPSSSQQGGIVQVIHGSHSGRIFSHSVDHLGRWATQIIRLKQGKSLAIISAYRPCDTNLATAGEGTVVKQQFRELRRRGLPQPNPRQLFLRDLQTHVISLLSDGHAILLGLDANLKRPDAAFDDFMLHCSLFDLLANKYNNPTATHSRGNRLDLILGCAFVSSHVDSVGILASNLGANSDHAAIYVDLSSRIFNKKPVDPTTPSHRGFRISNKTLVARFRNQVRSSLDQNSALQILDKELDSAAALPPERIEEICNEIDDILTDTVLYQEKLVKKSTTNTTPWSIQYRDARRDAYSWNKYLRIMMRTNTIPIPLPSQVLPTFSGALSYVKAQVTTAWKKLKAVKKNALAHRFTFLRDRIKHYDETSDPAKANAVRSMLQKEIRRETFRKLSRLIKGPNDSGLSKVLRPTTRGTIEEITEVEALYSALLERNAKHFSQAKDTPLACPPFSNILPPFHFSKTVDSILQGNLTAFGPLPKELRTFLELMQSTTPPVVDHLLTMQTFRDGMKKISEGKSSSMSGRHYGIYKALLPDDYFTGKVVQLINHGVKHGFVLRRWRKVLQVMLCKQPGNYNIDRLRVIQLIEADLNMFFRLIWGKRMVHNSLHTNRIPCEQFGAVPGSLAMSATLLKVLSFDLIRLLRSNASIFNNDATACYDRILPALSQICCLLLGLPKNAAEFKLLFLKKAEYYVKTQHGISDEWFGNLISAVYGVLQGSGSAPAIWLAVSIVLIKAYKRLFPTSGIPNPNGTDTIDKIIDAFVDDTDLWDILYGTNLPDQAGMERMQRRAQSWERLMYSSGGKLNLQKCFWYYVSWKWHNGIPRLATIDECPGDLKILSGNDETPVTITRVESTSALATLGVLTSPSGQTTSQFDKLKTTLNAINNTVRQTNLTLEEADMLVPVYIQPKLTYIFAGTTFDSKTCGKIDRLFLPVLKSKCGYNRTTKLEIIHGSYTYGGAQFPTSWDLQGSTHLNLLIGHLQLQDIVGKHLQHCMGYLYLLLGFQKQVMTYPIPPLATLASDCWLTNTWSYMTSIGATLVSDSFSMSPQRQYDNPIMEEASKFFKGITLLRVNAVRLYLRVFFLSDIVTSDGRHISPEYLRPAKHLSRRSLHNWPKQVNPGPVAWTEWRSMLKTCFSHRNFQLRVPLGAWMDVAPTQEWSTVVDPSNKHVYVKTGSIWQVYCPSPRSQHTAILRDGFSTGPPSSALPISATPHGQRVRLQAYAPREETIVFSARPSVTFPQFLRNLPSHEKWIIGHVVRQSSADLSLFLAAVKTGDIALGSDGSIRGQRTTYSSRIQSRRHPSVFLTSHSKGEPTCTMRAEAYGYLGCLYLLRAAITFLLQEGYQVRFPSTDHYMDNDGVLKRLAHGSAFAIKHHLRHHSDVIREIQAVQDTLPFRINRHHVKSHQHDDIDDITSLPLPALLNRTCDVSCTLAHSCPQCTKAPTQSPIFPSTKVYLVLNNQPHSSKIDVLLRHSAQDKLLRAYIITKENWTPATMSLVNVTAIRTAMYRSTANQKRSATKLIYKLWATDRELSKRTNSHDNRCQRCKRLNEDWDHVFRCPNGYPTIEGALSDFREYLRIRHVAPVMSQAILHGITTWLQRTDTSFDFSAFPSDSFLTLVQTAYMDQEQIGWSNFLRGRHAKSWLIAHDHYHASRRLHDRYSSTHLGPSLVMQSWDFCRAIWRARNEAIHGSTASDALAKQTAILDGKIRDAYASPDSLSLADQAIVYSVDLPTRLATQFPAKVKWYSLYTTCLHAPLVPVNDLPAPTTAVYSIFRPFQSVLKSSLPQPSSINPGPSNSSRHSSIR